MSKGQSTFRNAQRFECNGLRVRLLVECASRVPSNSPSVISSAFLCWQFVSRMTCEYKPSLFYSNHEFCFVYFVACELAIVLSLRHIVWSKCFHVCLSEARASRRNVVQRNWEHCLLQPFAWYLFLCSCQFMISCQWVELPTWRRLRRSWRNSGRRWGRSRMKLVNCTTTRGSLLNMSQTCRDRFKQTFALKCVSDPDSVSFIGLYSICNTYILMPLDELNPVQFCAVEESRLGNGIEKNFSSDLYRLSRRSPLTVYWQVNMKYIHSVTIEF